MRNKGLFIYQQVYVNNRGIKDKIVPGAMQGVGPKTGTFSYRLR